MWELYAMWALISTFFANFFAARGHGNATAIAYAGAAAFAVIAAGGIGSVLAGQWADRLGRERVTIWSMVVSGTCALTIGWLLDASPWLVVTVGVVWGFAIVADSAQFSAVVTEVAPPHAVGTALTLQTSLGFLLTAFSIWFTIQVQSRFGWPVAFGLPALGPVFGIAAMLRLKNIRLAATPGE